MFRIWILIFIYISESKFLLHTSAYWQKTICWIPPQCLTLIGKLWNLLRVTSIQKFVNFDKRGLIFMNFLFDSSQSSFNFSFPNLKSMTQWWWVKSSLSAVRIAIFIMLYLRNETLKVHTVTLGCPKSSSKNVFEPSDGFSVFKEIFRGQIQGFKLVTRNFPGWRRTR